MQSTLKVWMACWWVSPWRDSPLTSRISSPTKWSRQLDWCVFSTSVNVDYYFLSHSSSVTHSKKRNGYPLSVVHQLLQLHEGKWFWQKSPSDHVLSPAHQQYWILDPIKVTSQLMSESSSFFYYHEDRLLEFISVQMGWLWQYTTYSVSANIQCKGKNTYKHTICVRQGRQYRELRS